MVEEGIRRLATYQDRRYAALYLDRLDPVNALGSAELLRETARHLAVRMSFEDVIRVAQAKTAPDRMARVRAEVRAKPHEPLEITEHFKPGIEEICAVLPPALARRILAWAERTGRLGKVYFSMHVRTTTVWGFARLRFLASLRWWRPHSLSLRRGAGRDRALAGTGPRRRVAQHRSGARDRRVAPVSSRATAIPTSVVSAIITASPPK